MLQKAVVVAITLVFLGAVPPVALCQSLVIQEVLPLSKTQPPPALAKDAWSPGIQLAAKMMSWLSEEGLKRRVDEEIQKLQPQISKEMATDGGVLLVVGIQESKLPDANGDFHRSLLDVYVFTPAKNAAEAAEKYRKSDRLEQGVPQGWTRRNTLLWITKKR